ELRAKFLDSFYSFVRLLDCHLGQFLFFSKSSWAPSGNRLGVLTRSAASFSLDKDYQRNLDSLVTLDNAWVKKGTWHNGSRQKSKSR
ncbi:unnamed protein product, partial [Trichobilharzia szidati]